MKKKAYVIGKEISKSMSPTMFNYWFKKYNIDATYEIIETNIKNLERDTKQILNDPKTCGFNITIPFKEAVFSLIDTNDLHSQKIGAINCISRKKNKWVGMNTDWSGFMSCVNKRNFFSKKTAVVMGYGGASKAVVYGLQKIGFKEIKIFNRSLEKIKHLENKKGIFIGGINQAQSHYESAQLIINTIPINVLNKSVRPINKPTPYGFDIVYSPKETDFLSFFKKNKKIYGIEMLVYQAIPCFKEWFGIEPNPDKELFKILDKKIK